MGKVLFFGFPAHGHTNPTLALVRELIRRGERVIYYSYDEFQEKIEETGAEYPSRFSSAFAACSQAFPSRT